MTRLMKSDSSAPCSDDRPKICLEPAVLSMRRPDETVGQESVQDVMPMWQLERERIESA